MAPGTAEVFRCWGRCCNPVRGAPSLSLCHRPAAQSRPWGGIHPHPPIHWLWHPAELGVAVRQVKVAVPPSARNICVFGGSCP